MGQVPVGHFNVATAERRDFIAKTTIKYESQLRAVMGVCGDGLTCRNFQQAHGCSAVFSRNDHMRRPPAQPPPLKTPGTVDVRSQWLWERWIGRMSFHGKD